MADISVYLQAIQEAVYGEEVRGSIHDALQAMNNEISDVKQYVIDDVEAFIDNYLELNIDQAAVEEIVENAVSDMSTLIENSWISLDIPNATRNPHAGSIPSWVLGMMTIRNKSYFKVNPILRRVCFKFIVSIWSETGSEYNLDKLSDVLFGFTLRDSNHDLNEYFSNIMIPEGISYGPVYNRPNYIFVKSIVESNRNTAPGLDPDEHPPIEYFNLYKDMRVGSSDQADFYIRVSDTPYIQSSNHTQHIIGTRDNPTFFMFTAEWTY